MNEGNPAELSCNLPDEAATANLAQRLAGVLDHGLVLFLHGPLGAGKTSFARALLSALGVGERIKSPTYSLVEGYATARRPAWHLDLYRIADPAELEWLGLDAFGRPGRAGAGGVARTRRRGVAPGRSPRAPGLRRARPPGRPARRHCPWRRPAGAPVLIV